MELNRELLLDIFDETEEIYLDGFLNGVELQEPENELILENRQLSKILRHTALMTKKEDSELPAKTKIFVKKGDTINFVLDNQIEHPLILNFANPVHPGGGVRRGAKAQEEDLCRATNLLYALESENVKAYYIKNRSYSFLGSHNSILSKNVSIIRRTNGELLDAPVMVDVLTIAAPCIPKCLDVTDDAVYLKTVRERIEAMFYIAEYFGYKNLVLGAWGCGAFRNEPSIIANCFNDILHENDFDFDSVYFVIKADSSRGENNFNIFNEGIQRA